MAARKPLNFPNKTLGFLIQKTLECQNLKEKIDKVLSDDLRAHYEVSSYTEGTLHLITPNGAWASRFKIEQPDILQALRTKGHLPALRHIKISVYPTQIQREKPAKIQRAAPPFLSDLIQNCAKSETESPLKRALERLSLTLRNKTKL